MSRRTREHREACTLARTVRRFVRNQRAIERATAGNPDTCETASDLQARLPGPLGQPSVTWTWRDFQ